MYLEQIQYLNAQHVGTNSFTQCFCYLKRGFALCPPLSSCLETLFTCDADIWQQYVKVKRE